MGIDRLSQLLENPEKIVYNVMGREEVSLMDESFWFQYLDRCAK